MKEYRPFIPLPHPVRTRLLSALLLLTVCSDQFTKYLAREMLVVSSEKSFLGGLLKLSLIENSGGFLGIVSDYSAPFRFFFLNICVAVLLAGCLVYLLWFSKKCSQSWLPLAFITGGGLSNLLDRFFRDGGVTDFLVLGTGYLQTGIFNLADVYILFGSFHLGFQIFKRS